MNVAIYARKSKATKKGESISNQIELCKKYFLNTTMLIFLYMKMKAGLVVILIDLSLLK